VRREYLSLGRTDSTSTTPCAATTHPPVARGLHQLCRAPRLFVSRLHGLYLTHCLTARLLVGCASDHCVSRRDYSSSGLHRLYYAYAMHLDAPSRRSTSCQSVALALVVCPVIPLCVVTTRLAAAKDILRLRRASGCLGMSRGSSSTTAPSPCVWVPRHVARLLMRLIVDYFAFATLPRASARRAAHHAARRAARRQPLRLAQARRRLLHLHRASGCLSTSRGSSRGSSSTTPPRAGSSSTTSPSPHVRLPQHVARLVPWLIVDYFSSRGLVVDYFDYAARLGASARRAARHVARRRLLRLTQARHRILCLRRVSGCLGTSRGSLRHSSSTTPPRAGSSSTSPPHVGSSSTTPHAGSSSTTSPTPRVWVPRHVAWLIACRRLLRLRCATGCLGTSRGSSRGSLRCSSSTALPMPRVRVPRHVARPVTRLIVEYSVHRDFVLRPHWLCFSHALRRDYLSHDNTASTSSTPRAATTSSSGRIASTIHLDLFSKLVENGSHAPNN
jgi:hypothetical protein